MPALRSFFRDPPRRPDKRPRKELLRANSTIRVGGAFRVQLQEMSQNSRFKTCDIPSLESEVEVELRKLSDVELENNLLSLVKKERSLLCEIILHVIELERRKKYLNLHPNLFSYLRDKLKYSHGSAQRRIDAAVLALEVPALLTDVRSGELNATQITTAQVAFRLAAKTHKTRIPAEVKQKVLEQIKSKSVAESEVILYEGLNIKPKSRLKIKQQADESVHIEMTLTKEQWAKFQRTRELLSHSVPSGNFTDLIDYFTDRVIAQKDKTIPKNTKVASAMGVQISAAPEKNAKIAKSCPATFSNPVAGEVILDSKSGLKEAVEKQADPKIPIGKSDAPKHSGRFFAPSKRKAIKISIQREVFARDKCCQHRDKATGHICGSKWSLQLDHIQPIWAGGKDEVGNLRILCGQHNRRRYRAQAGLRH